MAKVTIGGVDYEVRPFKLRELRKAAPLLERIKEKAAGGQSKNLEGLMDSAYEALCVLSIGIGVATLDDLEAAMSVDEISGVWASLAEVQVEAGMKRSGEAKPDNAPANL